VAYVLLESREAVHRSEPCARGGEDDLAVPTQLLCQAERGGALLRPLVTIEESEELLLDDLMGRVVHALEQLGCRGYGLVGHWNLLRCLVLGA
jgi:hypothetical protein